VYFPVGDKEKTKPELPNAALTFNGVANSILIFSRQLFRKYMSFGIAMD